MKVNEKESLLTMNVAVPRVLKEWVQAEVKAGNYSSASEVVRDALRQLRKRTPLTPGMSG